MAFAVQGCVEHEGDQLDTLYRVMAPLMGAKLKVTTTARDARHLAVIEDARSRRAVDDAKQAQQIMEAALSDLSALGFEVEYVEPSKPAKR